MSNVFVSLFYELNKKFSKYKGFKVVGHYLKNFNVLKIKFND